MCWSLYRLILDFFFKFQQQHDEKFNDDDDFHLLDILIFWIRWYFFKFQEQHDEKFNDDVDDMCSVYASGTTPSAVVLSHTVRVTRKPKTTFFFRRRRTRCRSPDSIYRFRTNVWLVWIRLILERRVAWESW